MELMRYCYIFDNDLNRESVLDLIKDVWDFQDGGIDLFLSTNGGHVKAAAELIHFLKNLKDLRIFLDFELNSAGAEILYNLPEKCEVTYLFEGVVIHKVDRKTETESYDVSRDYRLGQIKELNRTLLVNYTEFFELDSFEQSEWELGRDVFINSDRVAQIIENKKNEK